MAETYLKERAGIYYFRRVLPSDVRKYFPCREISKSLRTSSQSHARILVRKHAANLDAVLIRIRSGVMTTEEIDRLVGQYLDYTLARDERNRAAQCNTDPMERFHQAIANQQLAKDEVESLQALLALDIYDNFTMQFADGVINTLGLPIEDKSPEYRTLCRSFIAARITRSKTETERSRGNYDNPYDLARRTAPEKNTVLLSTAISQYFEELIGDTSTTPPDEYTGPSISTIKEYQAACTILLDYVGDIYAVDLTNTHLRKFKGELANIPSHRTKKPETRNKSISEAIDIAKHLKLPCIGVAQREKIFSAAKRFITWASSDSVRIIPYNVADNISAPRKNKQAGSAVEDRKAYSTEDMSDIIDGLLREQKDHQEFLQSPERYWITLIALHSGLRAEEIAQLLPGDIKVQDGIHYFDANWLDEDGNTMDTEGNLVKHLKTASAKRIVPVHSVLLNLGFMEYVSQVRNAGHSRLWMNLSQGSNGKLRRKFSDWFNGTDRRFGFRKEYILDDDPKKVFHSTRHTVVNWYKQHDHEEGAVAELLGQKHPNVTFGTYGDPVRTAVKKEMLELMQHDVDFVGRLGHWYDLSGTDSEWVPPVNQGRAVRRRARKKK